MPRVGKERLLGMSRPFCSRCFIRRDDNVMMEGDETESFPSQAGGGRKSKSAPSEMCSNLLLPDRNRRFRCNH